jgi:hypothetical protein
MGCLRWLGALALLGVVAVAYFGGLGVFLVAGVPALRWGGVAAMIIAGLVTLVAARSHRFAFGVQLVTDPLGSGAADDNYRAVAGVHPGPAVVAIIAILAAIVCAAALAFP